MGQIGGPEQEGVSGVTSPTAPARMEVVMGKCFPLTGPGHHLNFPSYPATGTTTSTAQKKEEGQTQLSPQPSHTVLENSHSAKQNGVIPNTKYTPNTSQNYTSNSGKAEAITKTNKVEQNAASNHPGTKPKHPILRRAQSAVTSEPEFQKPSKSSTDSVLARIKAKVEQITPGKEDVSGREAWEITQKKKALMREEFFKIPYEECNKEAAMSLGGRLNKSEPRLNTICKDRKKRNSLSYKRRVHFDLDEDKDLDDDRPSSFTRRHSLQRVSNVGPPKKVVVSIYSIDDPAKRVQQVQLPDNYSQVVQESIVSSTGKPGLCQTPRDRNQNKIQTARPTDLDSLQRDTVPDKRASAGSSFTTKTQITRIDSDSPGGEKKSSSKSRSPRMDRRSSASTASEQVDKTETQEEFPATDGFQRRYSLPPRQQMSVRPRQPSAHFPSSTHHTATRTPVQQHHVANTSNSFTNTAPNGPVPAPRSYITTFKKSHSLQDSLDEQTTNTPPKYPRPDTLQLSTSTSQAPSQTNMAFGSVLSSRHTSAQFSPVSSQKAMPPPASTQTRANTHTATTADPHTSTRTPTSPQSSTTAVSPASREELSSPVNPPVPKPRKWISVSQQTGTPNQSPSHTSHRATHTPNTLTHTSNSNTHSSQSNTHTLRSKAHSRHSDTHTPQSSIHSPQSNTLSAQSNILSPQSNTLSPQSYTHTLYSNTHSSQSNTHTPQSRTHSSPVSNTYISQSNTHTPQSNIHTPQSNIHTPQSDTHTPQSDTQKSTFTVHPTQPVSQGSKTTMHTTKSVSSQSKPATHSPLYQTFSSPHVNHTSPKVSHTSLLKPQKSCTQIVQANGHTDPPCIIPTELRQKTGPSLSNKVTHKNSNKENQSERLTSQKTNSNGKGNSINILMTKGDSYSKHSIVLNSHINSTTPSVTVRKLYIPTSAPARCSPSPTPSCASSSCSFGSSGSSSGCFSGSPSPTPTPSPTRIRASGVPTDL